MDIACFCGNRYGDDLLFCPDCGSPVILDPHTQKLYDQMQGELERLIADPEAE